jgi:hypothetical protein
MFFLSCGALSRPFSLVFVKTLPKEERPSRKRKKEEYNKKRRERSGEIVKGRSSIYRKITHDIDEGSPFPALVSGL